MKTTLVFVLFSLAACVVGPGAPADDGSSGGGTHDDETPTWPDAGLPPSCEDAPPLELGRCLQAGTDLACTGNIKEVLGFVPLSDGDPMQLVLGPQGAQMLLFLARGSGFEPGDPDAIGSTDNPLVEMWLHDVEMDEEVARYRGYVPFVEEGDGVFLVTAGGLFAITEHSPAQLDGHRIDVEALLRDREGTMRCGSVEIVVAQ